MSLRSATEWLSSTAMRIFSSSSESVSKDEEPTDRSQNNSSPLWHPPGHKDSRTDAAEEGGHGRPRKDAAEPRRHNMTFTRELLSMRDATANTRTRSSALKAQQADPEGRPPMDGQTRYLLTLTALPRNVQILALALHPQPRNRFEEHRLACRLFNEHLQETARPEISIPTFRRLNQPRSHKDTEKGSLTKEVEDISDDACLQRHRPLELAERRERRREDELMRYEEYMRKLSREYPEILNRKFSFSSVGSSRSSID